MYIVSDLSKETIRTVGTKAWNLFILKKHFAVPEFVVVTTKGFEEYQKNKLMTRGLKDELKKILKEYLSKGYVAIRSSGTAEDLGDVSFAGMYTTILNVVDIDSGIDAIVRVWNSIDAERVRIYRKQLDIPPGDMAVIIQHQLKPDVSGVMVTQSPFSINEILIECCKGLGEKLVSGKITPAQYRMKETDLVIHKGDDLLTEDQLIGLVKTGKRIEKIFKSPQDVEWTIENDGLYVLQARPVLVNASMPRRRTIVWCNANVRETIPDPMSPMGWSIFDGDFFPGIVMDVFGLPITKQQYEKFRPVELISGRLYWNANNTIAYGKSIGPILDFIEGDKVIDPQMAQAFKVVDIENLPNPIPVLTMLWFSTIALIRMSYYFVLGFTRFRWMSTRVKTAHDTLNRFSEKLKPTDDMEIGVKNIREWMRFIIKKFARRYFGGLFLSIISLILLAKLLSIRMGRKGESISRKTIIGIMDRTGEMALALKNLAFLAKQKTKTVTLSNLRELYKRDTHFKNRFSKFINDFGHRGPAEFDVASANWREDYDMVYKVIATLSKSKTHRIDRKTMIHSIVHELGSCERFILKILLPRIEAFTPLRENGKDHYLRAMAKIKDQLFIIENQLIKQGYITKHRDIFFLTLDDLDNVLARRTTSTRIQALVDKRKDEWQMYRLAEAPDIIYASGERIFPIIQKSEILSGEPLSFGRVKAKARIIKDFADSERLNKGEILVAHHTDPGWTPLFTVAGGVIIEAGGVICHAAMVARELGVPAVVIRGAASLISDGQTVELDADEGRVTLL